MYREPSGKHTVGLLQRWHIRVGQIIYIGKESNKFEKIESGTRRTLIQIISCSLLRLSPDRDQWMKSKCVNIHDSQSPVYELTDEYDGCKALVKNFFMLLSSYQNHPESKSLGSDGKPCNSEPRGLLRRAHIVANWPFIFIGKESDKHWEEGEDLSLLEFQTIQYRRRGNAIANDEQLARIAKVPRREFMRRGINQHTLEKICVSEPVRAMKLAKCLKVLESVRVK